MKYILILVLALSTSTLYSENKVQDISVNIPKRDSTDKTCQILFNSFFESLESDVGLIESKITNSISNFFKYQADSKIANRQLMTLLQNYMDSQSDAQASLLWIQLLNEEYKNIYGKENPLLILFMGESLIKAGMDNEAYNYFIKFHNQFPDSTMALAYVLITEKNNALAEKWLIDLKVYHPNHWIVKDL